MSISLTWHGHATLSLCSTEYRLLIDPFFTGNPVAKLSAAEVDADFILLTHGHGDHVADAVDIASRCGATVIANFEVGNWIEAQGHEKVHRQHIGGAFQHPFGNLKMTQAFHGSALPDGSNGGMPTGLLLEIEGKRIYIAGDTGLFSDMKLIGADRLDLAILPIGDNFTMGPADALLAADFLKPKVVIPYHYNTWPLIEQDADRWAAKVRTKVDTEVIVLGVEGSYSL